MAATLDCTGMAIAKEGGIEIGASGLDNLVRVPDAQKPHRRTNAWTEQTFWEAARRFFRVKDQVGEGQVELI